MKVLVVDDDPLVCQSLKTILQADGGIDVVGMGHDGHEAVELFTQLEPRYLAHGYPHGADDRARILRANPQPIP